MVADIHSTYSFSWLKCLLLWYLIIPNHKIKS